MWLWLLKLPKLTAALVSLSVKQEYSYPFSKSILNSSGVEYKIP